MIIKTTHPFLSNSQDVIDIAKPLQQLGIIYFSYTKTETNGSRTYLTTHPHVLERYIKEEYYLIGNSESSPNEYNNQILFWDSLPKQYIFDNMTRANNIDHGIFMVNRESDYCEFYGFAAQKGNYQVLNAYINNLELLKKFTLFFKEQAKRIINKAEVNKLILPFCSDALNLTENSEKIIFQSLSTEQINTLHLSARQMDCAILLLKGKQYKEIARTLNISPRTVETHINYLKNKLNCSNKTQLLMQLFNSTLVAK
jgi:DNA-binding CsgD family transcriptional regulator